MYLRVLLSDKVSWSSRRLFFPSICMNTSRFSSSFLKLVFYPLLALFPSLCLLIFQSQSSSPTFSCHPSRTSFPKFPKTFFFTLFEMSFIPTSLLNICTTSFFLPFSFGIPHHQPWNSNSFNFSFQSRGGQLPLINPHLLAC